MGIVQKKYKQRLNKKKGEDEIEKRHPKFNVWCVGQRKKLAKQLQQVSQKKAEIQTLTQ